ncbi:retrovirus-related pol polyprotein from transposon TNT 1-94 [Tanacetum coccineum]
MVQLPKTKQDWLHKDIVRKKEFTMMKPLHQWQEWKPSGTFLLLLTYMNFRVYQMDVKSSFLNGEVLLVQVYVDDIIFGSTSYKLCKQFEKLMTKKFEMCMMGELTYFLRLQIKQDDKGISIFQEQYTRNLLKKYEISDSSSVKTPMVPPNNLGPDLAGKSVNKTSYRGMIGSLMSVQKDLASNNFEKKILRDHILKGDIELHFILTEYHLADIFTKPLDKPTFTRLKAELGMEFWSTVVAFDPFPSTHEPEKRPLKEFLIKFSVLNGQRPLTMDLKTFCSSTGLDYNNGKYVEHPTPETVLGGNYSSTKQVNSIQQLLAFSFITGTEVDIGEIIYRGNKPPANMEPINPLVVDPLGTDANDEEEEFAAGEDMDEDLQVTVEVRTPPKQGQPEPSQV